MQQPPLSVVETWPAPNYVDPVTRGDGNIILNIVLYTVLLFFLALRIFTRAYLKRTFGADDVFILLALIPATAFFIISILADAKFLWIRHVYDIPVSHVVTGLKMVLATEVVFGAATTLTKLSMLMLVRRMLSSATILWRRITLLAITIVIIQGSVFCLTVIFQCRPPQNYWKITTAPDPNCIDQTWSLLVAGIINAVTDLIAVLLPVRTVWTLQLPSKQLFIVVLLFSLGMMSCFAGIVRTYYMYKVTFSFDQTWDSYPVWITSAVELYIGMICASIPATKPFFTIYLPKLFGSVSPAPSGASISSQQQLSRHALDNFAVQEEELLTYDIMVQAGASGVKRSDSTAKSAAEESDLGLYCEEKL